MTTDLEQDIRATLARRASLVPKSAVDHVRTAHYTPRRIGTRGVVAVSVALATIAAGAAVLVAGKSAPAGAIAYVGSAPRLSVTALPAGYRPGPDIPVAVLPGQTPQPGLLPEKTFVAGSGSDQESIVVAEGTTGTGPVSKLLSFAARHPSVTSVETDGQRNITIVDLAAVNSGSSAVLYFNVGPSTWALVGGSPGVTIAELLAVANGLTGS